MHVADRDCPLLFTNGKGASRLAAKASALGEFVERLSCNYFWAHYYLGPEFAAVLWSEALYRRFDNRRQLAAYAGLAPTPWKSGSIDHEQGVSKAGNPRLRTTMIQVAWLWPRHQPGSALSVWFLDRVQRNGGRMRKSAIVALARKLLVAFWKYVTQGVVIEGAVVQQA